MSSMIGPIFWQCLLMIFSLFVSLLINFVTVMWEPKKFSWILLRYSLFYFGWIGGFSETVVWMKKLSSTRRGSVFLNYSCEACACKNWASLFISSENWISSMTILELRLFSSAAACVSAVSSSLSLYDCGPLFFWYWDNLRTFATSTVSSDSPSSSRSMKFIRYSIESYCSPTGHLYPESFTTQARTLLGST